MPLEGIGRGMARATKWPQRWKIFAVLASGLSLLGVAAAWMLFSQSIETANRAGREELLSLAQISSLQVDGDEHDKLTSPSQSSSQSYKSQNQKLANVLQHTRDIRFVYTVKKVGGNYHFILDPTPPGDADGDGVDDKSYLMDPMDEPSTALIQAFELGTPTVDLDPTEDRWGTWISGFAPIKNKDGKVVAVIGLDRDYRSIQTELLAIRETFRSTLVLVGTVSLAIAWLFAGIFGKPGPRRFLKGTQSLRRPWIELSLVLLVVVVVIDGTVASLTRAQVQAEQRSIIANLSRLSKAERILDEQFDVKNKIQAAEAKAAQRSLTKTQTPWLSSFINFESLASSDIQTRESMRNKVASERLVQEALFAQAMGDLTLLESRLQRVFMVAAGLAIFAIIILRYASQQDMRLKEVESESSLATSNYETVVEKLPLGLFLVRDGDITFANEEWDQQFGVNAHRSRWEALERGLHVEDREAVIVTIQEADAAGKPFTVACRTISSTGAIRHIQSRGEPIFDSNGEFQHLLCFCADLSPVVEAKLSVQAAYKELETKNKLLSSALAELEGNLESIVRSLIKAVEAKDPYTAGHSERVKEYSLLLGRAMGLGPYEMRVLELGSLVHDVGKIGIPDNILTKPDRLTDEEYELVKQHPADGVKIIEGIGLFQECLPIVRWHHERLDGTGYPDRIAGDEIPLLVRITAIADVFDAMVSTRAYRAGLDVEFVFNHLRESAAKGQLDASLVDSFILAIRTNGVVCSEMSDSAA